MTMTFDEFLAERYTPEEIRKIREEALRGVLISFSQAETGEWVARALGRDGFDEVVRAASFSAARALIHARVTELLGPETLDYSAEILPIGAGDEDGP